MKEKIKRMLNSKWRTKSIIVAIAISLSVITASAMIYNFATIPDHFIEDNGYYEGTGKFDKEKTPVTNMLIIVKVLNGSNLCDAKWYKEVRECQKLLKKQCVENKKDEDPYMKTILELQENIVNELHNISSYGLGKKVTIEDIDNLQKAFDAYSDYYYENYGERGNLDA